MKKINTLPVIICVTAGDIRAALCVKYDVDVERHATCPVARKPVSP